MVVVASVLGGIGLVCAIAALMGLSVCMVIKQGRQAEKDEKEGKKPQYYHGFGGRYCYHPLFI